jgi:hypothetical protein
MRREIISILMTMAVSLLTAGSTSAGDSQDPAAGEEIKWQVIASGGTDGSSENFRLAGTAGQIAVGIGGSENFGITHGFWQLWYIVGDADGSGEVKIEDVIYLIAYIFSGGPPTEPLLAGDADCSGDVDIDDVVYLILYLFSGGPAPGDPDGDGVPDC